MLLNNGTCPLPNAQLLRPEPVDDMFRNQIPSFPNHGRQRFLAAKPHLTNEIAALYPVEGDPPQGWGLTFMLANSEGTGRSRGTGHALGGAGELLVVVRSREWGCGLGLHADFAFC